MRCPFCSEIRDKVIDSRTSKDGDAIRRRRHCLECGRRFTTYERIDDIPYMVVKKDNRRERFERQKVLQGLLRACEKRPVTMMQMQDMVGAAESLVMESPDRECSSRKIGELLMSKLRGLDTLAYVRFASVYRDFQDIGEFLREIHDIGSGQSARRG